MSGVYAQKLTSKKETSKAFTFELTAGYNSFFTKDVILNKYAFSNIYTPVSPFQSFVAGIMLNPQIQQGDRKISVGFGISYGRVNFTQDQKTTDKNISVKLSSDYSFLRPDILVRFAILKNKQVLPYVSGGFGFNFSLDDKPVIDAVYDFQSPFDFFRNQKSKIRTVSFNPKLATGIIYKRSRLELSYGIPNDISDQPAFKLRTGYLGLNYYFSLTKP